MARRSSRGIASATKPADTEKSLSGHPFWQAWPCANWLLTRRRGYLRISSTIACTFAGAFVAARLSANRPLCRHVTVPSISASTPPWFALSKPEVVRLSVRSYSCLVLRCPSCGQENPAGARFCNDCGGELGADLAREVRKTVTVLFADVTDSTALGEQLDPESFRRVMARYFDTARDCLERHGASVEKFIGDAVMAVFGVPTVHDDDALRALRAASELRDSVGSLNVELERDFGVSLLLRTGVNTGDVVTGTEERLVTGDAVNVAARLEQAARPGEVLIGEQTFRLARAAIDVEPVEPLALKGKAESLGAYRLLRVVEGAPAFDRRLDAPLVGRRDELASCVRRSRPPSPSGVVGSSPCSGRRGSGSPDSRRSSSRLWPVRRQFFPAGAFPTARASPTGHSSRSSARRVRTTSSTRRSQQGRRKRSSGQSGRRSSNARGFARSHSSSTMFTGRSRRSSTSSSISRTGPETLRFWFSASPDRSCSTSVLGWAGRAIIALEPLSEAESEQLIEEILAAHSLTTPPAVVSKRWPREIRCSSSSCWRCSLKGVIPSMCLRRCTCSSLRASTRFPTRNVNCWSGLPSSGSSSSGRRSQSSILTGGGLAARSWRRSFARS